MSYCTSEDVNNLFGDISDDVSEQMLETAINNSDAWIDVTLKRNYVPIPTMEVDALQSAAIYYSASDILLSLYQGSDEMPVQYDTWFQKAKDLLEGYIDAYLIAEADQSEKVAHQSVKCSHGRTYNQKRGRRGVRGWVR